MVEDEHSDFSEGNRLSDWFEIHHTLLQHANVKEVLLAHPHHLILGSSFSLNKVAVGVKVVDVAVAGEFSVNVSKSTVIWKEGVACHDMNMFNIL